MTPTEKGGGCGGGGGLRGVEWSGDGGSVIGIYDSDGEKQVVYGGAGGAGGLVATLCLAADNC
jgi:hypothetical protein